MTIGPENPYRVEVDHTAEMRCYVDSKPRSMRTAMRMVVVILFTMMTAQTSMVSPILMMGVQDGQCQMGILGEIHRYQLPPCHSTGITVFPPHLEIPKKNLPQNQIVLLNYYILDVPVHSDISRCPYKMQAATTAPETTA